MNRILKVTLSHPYIEEGGPDESCEMRRLIRKPLEVMCTTSDARGVL